MSTSIFHGAGYFMNDDRASGGKLAEDDVLACSHCNGALKKREWKLQGAFCTVCHKPLCVACGARANKFGCEGPEVKRIERAINEHYKREQNTKLLGL